MFTPREIRETDFEKVARGYNIEDVDGFLAHLADQTEQLIAAKDEADKKMQILADRIEQYRSEEDALKNAMISAEKLKESLLAEAQQQKDIVVRDAQQKADRLVEDAEKRIEREEVTLKALKQQVATFKSEILNIYKAHLEIISDLPDEPMEADYDEAAVSELFKDTAKTETAEPAAPAEAAPATENYDGFAPRSVEPAAAETEEAAPAATFGEETTEKDVESNRFGKLEFGENFSFGRE